LLKKVIIFYDERRHGGEVDNFLIMKKNSHYNSTA